VTNLIRDTVRAHDAESRGHFAWPARVAVAVGGYAVLASVVTLIGWIADVPRLTDWKNDGISMFPNAAACGALSGIAVVLARDATRPVRAAIRLPAVVAALVGGMTLLEHVTGASFGIDALIIERPWGQMAAAAPMRMGPPASLSFLLAGTALLLATLGPRARACAAGLGAAVVAIGTLSLTGHLYGASEMYTLPRLTGIAMQTASVIVAIGLGVIATVPEHEPVRTLIERSASGLLVRRAWPVLIGFALMVGWLRVFIEDAGLVDVAFGTAIRTMFEVLLLTAVLWGAAARLRRYEEALRASEEELRHQDRRKDEFIAILAHELRNPLGPVRNAARYLKLRRHDDPALARPVEMIERQVTQMARLIDDLLDVSRVSRGALSLRRERVACAEIVAAAIDACHDDLDAKGHRLRVSMSPEPIVLDADKERLVQVLSNLLGNAAKYTPAGGNIDVAADVVGDGMLAIAVKDDGSGIPPDRLSEIFELFARVENPLGEQGGLGIGLTLVRQLVELHGGSIEARSDGAGKGSEFVVRLPVVVHGEPPAVAPPGTSATSGGLRIVVADDNPDAVESLTLLLEIGGHTVRGAYDGEDAIRAIADFRPHVAFVDIGMPKANGYEVARRVRAEPRGGRTHLVALTGWGQESEKERAREAGFDAHLVKPVPPEMLEELLARLPAATVADDARPGLERA